MDKEHVKGTFQDVKGSLKETAGDVTGNRKLQGEGYLEQAEGAVRKTIGDAKDTGARLTNAVSDMVQPATRGLEDAIRANPVMAIAIAAGVGLLIGTVLAR